MGDPLYARLNARGLKQFRGSEPVEFEVSYPDYSKIGLPAHKAALDGNLSCLRDYFLAKHQKDEGVPSRDVNGATPLHLASRTNRIEVIRWLLRFTDMSPVTAAKHGETPAHVAAAQGNVECLKVMVSSDGKSDVKASLATSVDNSGFTTLHLSIVKFRNDCAKLLVTELGAKGVGPLNESGITAAHVAASAGNVEILKFLSQKHKRLMTQQAADGTTAVYFAAQEGRLDAIKFLTGKLKCELTTPSSDGLKPIHAAAQCGHTHIVKFIVSQLGNPIVFDSTPDGATPLHFAASSGQVGTARWLLNCDLAGSLITTKDKNGDTAAHDAADNGQTTMLKFLLESGADLYTINNEGNTPYSLALSGQNTDTANFVMTYASKTPQKQESGPSQMTIYDLQGDVDIVDLDSTDTGAPNGAKSPERAESSVAQARSPKEPAAPAPAGKKASKKAKKEKPEKKQNKKDKSKFLNLDATTEVLKSLETPKGKQSRSDDIDDLEMTDEEMAAFRTDKRHDDGEIVVRYTGSENKQGKAKDSEAKSKKKFPKSLQKALKPSKKKVADANRKSASKVQQAFSESSEIKTFEHKAKIPSVAPPTPPPTPATGASITTSEDTPQGALDEDEEEVDEDDGNPYDYSAPDVTLDQVQPVESENKKLLGVALEDLSGDEEKPAPESISSSSIKEEKTTPKKIRPGVWPPPNDDIREPPPEAGQVSKSPKPTVVSKWKPREWKKESAEEVQHRPSKIDIKSWAKNVERVEVKRSDALKELAALKKPSSPEPKQEVVEVEIAPPPQREEPIKKFVALKPVKREATHSKEQDTTKEALLVRLKKSEGKQGASYSKPDTEIASGASDELMKKLKNRQN